MEQTDIAARYASEYEAFTTHLVSHPVDPEGVTISCYENVVPEFVEAELIRIYGNLYSSLAQFRIYGNGRDTSTYLVSREGKLITAFLFQIEGRKLRVLNQVIRVEEQDVRRFSNYIFTQFSAVSVISFDYVHTNIHDPGFPYQRINISEDIVLRLPETVDKYQTRLGKNTRRNIRRYTKKLLDTNPSFDFEVLEKNAITPQVMREIVALNRARMAGKDKVSAIDEIQTERSVRLARECGMLCVARIEGKVCAGSICFQIGSNYFFSVIAHDPQYDDCCLGYLCSYRTICECITREGNEFHFLWGEYEYKYSLLGQKRELDKLAIYRSRADFFLNSGVALRTAFEGRIRQAILWLHKTRRQDGPVAQIAFACLRLARRLRRLSSRLAIGEKAGTLEQSQES